MGGILTVKLRMVATAPTIQCVANVLIRHNSGTTPTAAEVRALTGKQLFPWGGGTTNNAVSEWSMVVIRLCVI